MPEQINDFTFAKRGTKMNRLFIIEQIQTENGYRYRIGYNSKKTSKYTVCASRDTLDKAIFFVIYIAKSNNYTIKMKEV